MLPVSIDFPHPHKPTPVGPLLLKRPLVSAPLAEPEFCESELQALGARLRQLRESKGWSMKRLADESGVSITALQRIEVGAASAGLATAVALCDALGQPLEQLVHAVGHELLARKFTHVAVPKRPTKALDLTGTLTDAHVNSRVIVVRAGVSQPLGGDQVSGAMFVFVLSGDVRVFFGDGVTENLGAGDSLHVSLPERMEWSSVNDTDAEMLCIVDARDAGGQP